MLRSLASLFASCILAQAASAQTVYLDADTANEVDDLYAIAVAFEHGWDIPALGSTQWQNSQWATAHTMEDSYRLNQHLVAYLGVRDRTEVLRGGHRRMYDWGHMAVHSPASAKLIELARASSPDTPLVVVALGALTNVASALFVAPDIAERIELFWLGSTYDFAADRARYTDFNALMDPQAAQLVLEHPTLRTHVLPVSEVGMHTVRYGDVAAAVGERGALGELLLDRWRRHMDGSGDTRVLWDVGIVELLADPTLATEVPAPGYGGPNVTAYRDLRGAELFAGALARLQRGG